MKKILIIGAGLGGLTAAIALVRRGFRVRVFEQSAALGDVGAGITLNSGALRCLEVLGLGAAVRAESRETVGVPFRHYRTGELLRSGYDADKPLDPNAIASRQMHRADLHALLAAALRDTDPEAIVLKARLQGFAENGSHVTAAFADGTTASGDLLVACDGVRSIVRAQIGGPEKLAFTGQVAFRCLVPVERLRSILDTERGSVFIGPGRTINRYPLRHGTIMNCVGLAKTDAWQEEGWNTPATNAEFLAEFAGWHPEVTGLIEAAPPDRIIKWALFARDPVPAWSAGRAVLLGDAAHPMLPFLGLGASMAIEDGVILARALGAHDDPEVGLRRYEAARKPRTTQIWAASALQGRLTQSADPEHYGAVPSPAHDPAIFDFDPLAVAVD
jgi:salicylate hydroxylase